jgi:hypothetical protein
VTTAVVCRCDAAAVTACASWQDESCHSNSLRLPAAEHIRGVLAALTGQRPRLSCLSLLHSRSTARFCKQLHYSPIAHWACQHHCPPPCASSHNTHTLEKMAALSDTRTSCGACLQPCPSLSRWACASPALPKASAPTLLLC